MYIPYSGLVSKQEFSTAIRIHYRHALKWIRIACAGILAILIFAVFVMLITQSGTLPAITFRMLIPGLIFLTFPWWTPLLQANSYGQPGNMYHSPIRGAITDAGITLETQNAKTDFLWTAYTHFVKTDHLVLAYQSKNGFHIYTQSMFSSAADWEAFIRLLEEKIKRGNVA